MSNLFFIVFWICLGLAAYISGAVRDLKRSSNCSSNQ